MSQTRADELLVAVQDFLRREVLPQLDGFAAYNTRVAANSLGERFSMNAQLPGSS